MASQKLFVTGAAGFIGSAFAGQRIAAGDRVLVYDALTYAGHRENLAWIEGENLRIVVGDICDGENVLKLLREFQPDAIVNFAAESHVDNSIAAPGAFITTNILGTYAMLEAARLYWNALPPEGKQNFRYVQVSTDEVYGSLGDSGYFTEASQYQPNSPYSASKAAGDHLAHAWFHTYGLPTIVTNCTNNYGPRQFPEKLIPVVITKALAGEKLPVYGTGTNVRDWIHVEDHCHGVWLAASKGNPGETYCFGGRAERDNLTVVKCLCAILDELRPRADGKPYEQQIAFVQDRAGHDFRYAMDDKKSEKVLGFTRRYTFEEGLKATVQWYLDNGAWAKAVTKKS